MNGVNAWSIAKRTVIAVAALVLVPAATLGLTLAYANAAAKAEAPYVIEDTKPFMVSKVSYRPECTDHVISIVKDFAKRPDTIFLLGGQIGPTYFNASANSKSLNLHAMHVGDFDGQLMNVTATARGEPTAADRAAADKFEARLEAAC